MPRLKDAAPSGPLASGLANIVTFILTPWGIVMATAIAAVAAIWHWATSILFTPQAAVFGGVWLLLFWTWIGLRTLKALSVPREVITVWDCAHCIAVEGITLAFDKDNTDASFQVVVNFRNLGNGPIRLKPEEYRVQINDRVAPERTGSEIVIARLSTKGVASGLLKKEAIPALGGDAKVTLVMIYGRHDGEFTRRYTLKGVVTFKRNGDVISGGAGGIESESDEEI